MPAEEDGSGKAFAYDVLLYDLHGLLTATAPNE